MADYTNEEIMANRRTWIDFLKEPERQKGFGRLEHVSNSEQRCCLGHACFILGAERSLRHEDDMTGNVVTYNSQSLYPDEKIWKALGLKDHSGRIFGPVANLKEASVTFTSSKGLTYNFDRLADLNDDTRITPQEIGEFLESVIEGGEGSPFIKLD